MKRRLGYLGLWLVATVLAVGMAWLGLRSVLVAAAPGRLDLLDQLGADNPRGRDVVALGLPTSVPGAADPIGRGPSGIPIQPPGPGPAQPGVPGPGVPDPGGTNPAGPTVTTPPPSPRPTENGTKPSTSKPVTTTTTNPQSDPSLLGQPEPQTRTVRTKGGDSTLRFAENDVSVITARPVSGHAVKVERTSPTSVIVTFSSPTSLSRIQATWNEGPAWRITEYQYH
ncbi:hypothetical protein [Allokutzneria albata]|uniref:Uncharacterized protein n=1 Tax=Allokutzneria albata TaxID=211114 RepID=A0A1H0DDG9_ALLAB|nr:hypothetical protein [Allokutzneria albata]SDN68046.1 hypothetical protein SAMN04489726_7730 [Allokutzneria albata]